MSNSKVVVVNTAPTSIAIARLQADDKTIILCPVLFADGAEPVMIPVDVRPERAEQLLRVLATPMLGGLMLQKLAHDKGLGQLRKEVADTLDIVYGPQELELGLLASGAQATNVDTGVVTYHGDAKPEDF